MKFKIEVSLTQEDIEGLIRKALETHPATKYIDQKEIYVSWSGGNILIEKPKEMEQE